MASPGEREEGKSEAERSFSGILNHAMRRARLAAGLVVWAERGCIVLLLCDTDTLPNKCNGRMGGVKGREGGAKARAVQLYYTQHHFSVSAGTG